jgi:hypothetical protein
VERLCGAMEAELCRIGGDELLADVRVEAEWYAALYFHWDGTGEEPLVRMRARADILSMRLERALDADGDLA